MPYKDKEKGKERKKQWYINNRERILKHNKEYRNREDINIMIKKYKKIYYQNNKISINKHKRYRYKTDIKFKLNCIIGKAIRKSLISKKNKRGNHWETLVGYTINDLFKHLKKTMPKDYCWKDFIEGKLHIDHIIPISVFNYTQPEHHDFKRCWSLENLRLLPSKENIIKGNKLIKSFQPALNI